MKKLLLLLLCVPMIGVGQNLSFREIINITSQQEFVKVALENSYSKSDNSSDDHLIYGYNIYSSTNVAGVKSEQAEAWAEFIPNTKMFAFSFFSDEFSGSSDINTNYEYIKEQIINKCNFSDIEEISGIDVIYYSCPTGKFQGQIGYFVDKNPKTFTIHSRLK